MKTNWFKYVFIVFIIIIVIFSIYKIKKDEEVKHLEEEVITSHEEQIKEIKLGVAGFDTINPILSNNKNIQDI